MIIKNDDWSAFQTQFARTSTVLQVPYIFLLVSSQRCCYYVFNSVSQNLVLYSSLSFFFLNHCRKDSRRRREPITLTSASRRLVLHTQHISTFSFFLSFFLLLFFFFFFFFNFNKSYPFCFSHTVLILESSCVHDTWIVFLQTLEAVKRIRPKRVLMIGLSHDFDYHKDNELLIEWSRRYTECSSFLKVRMFY